jgi:oxaloacetate decarboxylase gamma subunit
VNVDQLLIQSLQLLGLGMGSVFIILSLLIGIITIISRLVPEELPIVTAVTNETPPTHNNQHIAAIQAAIHKYRKSRVK